MYETVQLKTLNPENKQEFLSEVRDQLLRRFNVSKEEDLPENYSYKRPWSLLSMILEGQLDT
jgi:hypothetical protein